ncbi:hypothetical protein ACFV0R_15755 [Streptomyces sp. NPDC059578]|uniref:hypothetical protein n=1 Tax=Streptomyces sp. NPDC059578 TaxID=3346874 RepID=UPI0036857302
MQHTASPGVTTAGEKESSLTPRPLADWLTEWASDSDLGGRAAVAALVQEDVILAREDVRDLLVIRTGPRAYCHWARFEDRYRTALVLDASERAFLDLVVAIAFPRQVPLWPLERLGERRLAIILRALAALGGSDAIAVGVRT